MLKTVYHRLSKSLWVVALMSYCLLVNGQNSNAPAGIGDSYFITNARVHVSPSEVCDICDIVVDNGVIVSVGRGLTPSYDAQIFDLDSMHVYAGFIAGLTHQGIMQAEEGDREDADNPGQPGYDRAGIHADELASDYLDADKGYKAARENGFAMLHVARDGRMLPGQTSIVTTHTVGDPSMRLYRDHVTQYARLRGAGGVYPNTVIAVMSKMRELYRNAAYSATYQESYAADPTSKAAPLLDPVIQSLIPATRGDQPIYYRADRVKDIFRILKLKEDLGFDLVLVECREAYKVADRLKEEGVPVMLSLKLPDEPEEVDSTNQEILTWYTKKVEAYRDAIRQAHTLDSLGVAVIFSMLETKVGKVHSSITKLVEMGLDSATALAAITTAPAALLDIDEVAGTIAAGKMAHMVVTDKALWTDGGEIQYVWVSGQHYKMDVKAKKDKGTPAEGLELVGTWTYTIDIPGSTQTGKFIFEKSADNTYNVSIIDDSDPSDTEDVDDINVDGANVSFPVQVDNEGFTMDMNISLDFDGETYDGTINITEFGAFPIEGKRISDPE